MRVGRGVRGCGGRKRCRRLWTVSGDTDGGEGGGGGGGMLYKVVYGNKKDYIINYIIKQERVE